MDLRHQMKQELLSQEDSIDFLWELSPNWEQLRHFFYQHLEALADYVAREDLDDLIGSAYKETAELVLASADFAALKKEVLAYQKQSLASAKSVHMLHSLESTELWLAFNLLESILQHEAAGFAGVPAAALRQAPAGVASIEKLGLLFQDCVLLLMWLSVLESEHLLVPDFTVMMLTRISGSSLYQIASAKYSEQPWFNLLVKLYAEINTSFLMMAWHYQERGQFSGSRLVYPAYSQ